MKKLALSVLFAVLVAGCGKEVVVESCQCHKHCHHNHEVCSDKCECKECGHKCIEECKAAGCKCCEHHKH